MKNIDAEENISAYLPKIYGFALKRTANLQDAEDLTQDIALKVYRVLTTTKLENIQAFIWKIAHNSLVDYYKTKSRISGFIGLGDALENADEINDNDIFQSVEDRENVLKLKREIAYLSKIQRQIIILYYYDGKKQKEISKILKIPLGTVKWHLFEAKSELKKGMENMKNTNNLKFDPIKFSIIGLNGSVGSMGGTDKFFRSLMSQNIAYAVYREAKTVNEIADDLNISPVFIESEADFLEEYSYLIKQGDKYLANIIIDEPNKELSELQTQMYTKASGLIAERIFEKLMNSDLLKSEKLYYPDGDKNFLMWSLLLFIIAWCEDANEDEKIRFDDAATYRKDGGRNIAHAVIADKNGSNVKYSESMSKWFGPLWNSNENILLWQINSEWSDRNISFDDYAKNMEYDLKLLHRFVSGDVLSQDEYVFLAQRGYIAGTKNNFKLSVVWLKDNEIKQSLLEIGKEIIQRHKEELRSIKEPYCKALLKNTPAQMKKAVEYEVQNIFASDGWFLLYSTKALLSNGKLKLPDEEQRKSLSTVILSISPI